MSKLYGVGVGPGDPELLTIKAIRVMTDSEVILVPGEKVEDSVAYQIAVQACPQLLEKQILSVDMPMTKDKIQLEEAHQKAAQLAIDLLKEGKQVAFLTLGDPCVYSTYLYIHRLVDQAGYATEIVSGIPSFCATAARFNMGLVENVEELHILPATYQIEEGLELSGTRVLMKAGKKLADVKQKLQQLETEGQLKNDQVCMIENCGFPDEKCYRTLDEMPDQAGYFSLVIVKENEKE